MLCRGVVHPQLLYLAGSQFVRWEGWGSLVDRRVHRTPFSKQINAAATQPSPSCEGGDGSPSHCKKILTQKELPNQMQPTGPQELSLWSKFWSKKCWQRRQDKREKSLIWTRFRLSEAPPKHCKTRPRQNSGCWSLGENRVSKRRQISKSWQKRILKRSKKSKGCSPPLH